MGLLTDPSAGQGKIVKLLIKYYAKLCAFLYIAGVVYFCLLASPQVNNATYFSENALLPGLVNSELRNDNSGKIFYEELLDEMKKYDNSIPYPWLLAKFRQIGLDTYTQNFTLNFPLGTSHSYQGKNVYAIIRAPRAASTESLILSVPFRPLTSVNLPTTASIAVMFAFAKFAIKEKYWAKDLIFLITEHEQLGMQAWLEAYHGVSCGTKNTLISGDMKGRAGAIQATLNLEFHDTEIGQIDLKIEGLNGQMPNLDLFNLAARMCVKEGLKCTFKNRPTNSVNHMFRGWNLSLQYLSKLPKKLSTFIKEWSYNFQTLMSMVATQATGIPNGNHGLYYRFGIQAVTLEGFPPVSHRVVKGGFYTMGRILEGTFRSLNNLLERFHQSFFFYLLPSTDRYISIGLYIPAIVLLVSTLFIKAYAKWCQLHENLPLSESSLQNASGDTSTKKTIARLSEKEAKALERKHNKMNLSDWKKKFDEECEKESPYTKNDISLGHVCLVFVSSHILGFLLKDFPKYASQIGISYGYPTEQSVFFGLIGVFALAIPLPLIFKRPCYRSMTFLNILALIEMATAMLCVSMYNISIAMFMGVIYVPLALLINPSNCRFCSYIQKILWLIAHPLSILIITVMISTYVIFPTDSPKEVLSRGMDATQKALVFSIVDSHIYGNWLYNVITSIFVSNWICFWYVTFSKPKESACAEVSSHKKVD